VGRNGNFDQVAPNLDGPTLPYLASWQPRKLSPFGSLEKPKALVPLQSLAPHVYGNERTRISDEDLEVAAGGDVVIEPGVRVAVYLWHAHHEHPGSPGLEIPHPRGLHVLHLPVCPGVGVGHVVDEAAR
jgi:hypothetical protein